MGGYAQCCPSHKLQSEYRGDIPALVYINTDLLNRRLAYTAEKVFV